MDPFAPLSELPYSTGDFPHLLPLAIPALAGVVVLIMDLYLGRSRNKAPLALITLLACSAAALSAWFVWKGDQDALVMGGSLVTSSFGSALALSILLGTAILGFAVAHHGQSQTSGEAPRNSIAHGELYGLMMFATSGMLALVVANDLVTFFVAIETLSLAVYALTGVDRRRARSAEGAMKYFVLGAFSSAFLLYGMSLLYGATHTLRLDEMARAVITPGSAPMASVGGLLLLVGLLFKIGAVPFHAWVPDAYEGAPTAVTGFMSVGVKVAAVGGSMRVVTALGSCGAFDSALIWVLWVAAAVTIIAGNAGALTQKNPRRLLAYSGIAHTGYLLVGLVALTRCFDAGHPGPIREVLLASKDAVGGVLFYLLAYALANVGAFAVLCHLERKGEEIDRISDLAGLGRTQPMAALVMTISLVSLAGVPGTAGFLGKLWVFRAGVGTGDVGLVLIALIASAISLYYYLYVVVVMYMHEPGQASAPGVLQDDRLRWGSRVAMWSCGLLTIVLGLTPDLLNKLASGKIRSLLQMMKDGGEALL